MSGHPFTTKIPIADCGCGGKGIIWEKTNELAGVTTVEAFCGKYCGIGVTPHVVNVRDDGLKVVRTWNRAMSA